MHLNETCDLSVLTQLHEMPDEWQIIGIIAAFRLHTGIHTLSALPSSDVSRECI
jgi:hypothetical protein